jgi:hypothetical protein
MIKKINRQECLSLYPFFPQTTYDEEKGEEIFVQPDVVAQYIVTLPSKTFRGHARDMGLQLAEWMEITGIDSLIFLGDRQVSWRYQDNEFKPVSDALQYLAANQIEKNFKGAIMVDIGEMAHFIKHFAWLVRCNASLPYFSFTDPGQNIMGRFCQFGNLHLDILNKGAIAKFKEALLKTPFEQITEELCYNRFGKTSAIHGRRIVV